MERTVPLAINDLIFDPHLQSRVNLDLEWCRQLSRFLKDGSKFPPIGVMEIGGRLLVYSGFHRCKAAQYAGIDHIDAFLKTGTHEEAIILSVRSNQSNGVKPLISEDIKKSAFMLFGLKNWWIKSDRAIASEIKCHKSSVASWRAEFAEKRHIEMPDKRLDSVGRLRTASGGMRKGQLPHRPELIENYSLPRIHDALSANGLDCTRIREQDSRGLGEHLLVGGYVLVTLYDRSNYVIREAIARAVLCRRLYGPESKSFIVHSVPLNITVELRKGAEALEVGFIEQRALFTLLTGRDWGM